MRVARVSSNEDSFTNRELGRHALSNYLAVNLSFPAMHTNTHNILIYIVHQSKVFVVMLNGWNDFCAT